LLDFLFFKTLSDNSYVHPIQPVQNISAEAVGSMVDQGSTYHNKAKFHGYRSWSKHPQW
jgi:hypothetical protein